MTAPFADRLLPILGALALMACTERESTPLEQADASAEVRDSAGVQIRVEDGPQGFIDYFERMAAEYPDKSIDFRRAVAEGDLVALHTHQVWPGAEEYVTMDFFRFDDAGKIVEHWDSIQKVPPHSKNGRPMW